jgi:16S rRNA processing protein RimM
VPKPPRANSSPLPLGEVAAPKAWRVRVATIGRPHGVRGLVHVTSYTEPPEALARYTPLTDDTGRQFSLRWRSESVAELTQLPGTKISDRTAAETLVNTRLYVSRDQLPAPDPDEFYIADLIGLTATDHSGNQLGRIIAIHDYGAGTSLETETGLLVPFTRATVPEVNLTDGLVIVVPPIEVDVAGPKIAS